MKTAKKLKTVRNWKTWEDFGWIYRMERVYNGQIYGINVAVPHQDLHYRNGIARQLRLARHKLTTTIEQIRLQAFT